MPLAAVIQLNSNDDFQHNLARLTHWIQTAATAGADLVALPENCLYMGPALPDKRPLLSLQGSELAVIQDLANRCGVEVLLGSLPERHSASGDSGLAYNSSVLLYPTSLGKSAPPPMQVYRKMHLFDVTLPNDESYHESDSVVAGDQPLVAHSRCGAIGMSICYDLRFPELYRLLVEQGAELLAVPSAFTYETGKEHWLTLLKARAIENLAYVLAPAQTGLSQGLGGQRRCYGHSLIIDPWGGVLAELPEECEGAIYAEINLDYLRHIRQKFPSLRHRKLFTSSSRINYK